MYKNLMRVLAICIPLSTMLNCECMVSDNEQVATEEETENYPFKKSQSQLANEDVVGIRVKDNKIILLGNNYTFSSENTSKAVNFSDINFFTKYPNLISVELCGLTLTKEIMENLRKHLPTTVLSIVIDMCDVKDIESFSGVINEHTQLKSLTLRLFKCSAEDAENILSSFTEHSKLKFLNLGFATLNNNAMVHLSDVISRSKDSLKHISLAWENSEEINPDTYQKLSDSLKESSGLKRFELAVMSFPQNYLKIFFGALGHMQSLTDLKLFFGNTAEYDNVTLYESTEVLQTSLDNMPLLASLDISESHLSSEPLQLIFRSVANMSKLQTLNISGNSLDVKAAEVLSTSISSATELKTLLANECDMTAEVFGALCRNLANTGLRYLYFRGNQIKDGAKSLPISSMNDVLIIDFSQNDMSYDNAMDFIKQTANHPKLHIVNFKNNSAIEALSGPERAIRNDELVEWKIKNYASTRQVSYFGL